MSTHNEESPHDQSSKQEDTEQILNLQPSHNIDTQQDHQRASEVQHDGQNNQTSEKQQKSLDLKTERSILRQKQLENAYGSSKSTQFLKQPSIRTTQSQQCFRTSDQFDTKIVHDQMNNSTTKQLFTFSKAQRFTKATESYCSTQFYDSQMQSLLGQRGTTLGYGEKSDFTKTDKHLPGPFNYDIRSSFVKNKSAKGVKFAFGRKELQKQGLLGNMNAFPGPGTYNVQLSQTNFGYTLGEKTNSKHIYLASTTPPPGAYDIGGLNAKGVYFVGKYKGSGAAVFSPTSSHYDKRRLQRQPGPGAYNPPGDIQDANQFMPSQYLFQQGFQFGQGIRKTQQLPLLKTPGPGTYSVPSEFGDWDFPPIPVVRSQEQNSRFNKTDGFLSIKG